MSQERAREIQKRLEGKKKVPFKELLRWMTELFGSPRTSGSHHIFKMPWAGNPRVNLQADGKDAKPYQVKQCREAVEKYLEPSAPKEKGK